MSISGSKRLARNRSAVFSANICSRELPSGRSTVYGERPPIRRPSARATPALLRADPPDFALLGIGENGHLAFNDPPVADFDDPLLVKVVTLDDACRRQQVHDGAFAALQDVPQRAITVTIPVIVRVPKLFLAVPGARKRKAVQAALQGPLTTACPASILKNHPEAHLFLDQASARQRPRRSA